MHTDCLLYLLRQCNVRADSGALVGTRELIAQLGGTAQARLLLTECAIAAARDGLVSLHRHDYATSLSQADLDTMFHVPNGDLRNSHYVVGVAIR